MKVFTRWLIEQHAITPYLTAPYGIVPIVAKAGIKGVSRKELGERLTLEPPHLLDSLLAAFVAVGLLSVARENGMQVYRTTWGG